MADNPAVDYLDRYSGLAQRRDQWSGLWQDLADLFHPTRGGFTGDIQAGAEINAGIYDATPMQARRGLATAIDGLMKPSTTRWFWIKASNEDLNEDYAPKEWFDVVGDRMWAAIYSPTSRFIQQSQAVDNDIATFGLGYLWIGENRNKNGLSFRSLPIGCCAIDESSDGVIDTFYYERKWTARQAAQALGRENIGGKVLEALNSGRQEDKDKLFEFVQCVHPRDDYDPAKGDNLNMPYELILISKNDNDPVIVEEGGFQEFPVAVPRWEVRPGEIYPRSPAMLALADSRTLQAMGKTMLVAGEKAADPPVWGPDDGMIAAMRTYPGGYTPIDAQTLRDMGGKPPMGVLEMGKNLPLTREMQQDVRNQVGNAFFKDVFTMPVEGRDMTATEVEERKAQFLRTIGPTLAQLETDYIGTVVTRVYGIMSRAGVFPKAPEELQGKQARFEFMSPVQRAKREMEAAGLGRAIQFISPLLSVKPSYVDKFDLEEIIDDLPDAFGLREKWIVSKDRFAAMQQQNQQQQQMMAAIQGGAGVAAAAKDGADANKALVEANVMQQQPQGAA